MQHKIRTLRRLGVVGLGATLALGTPVVGLLSSASAATTGIAITSQSSNTASSGDDGTNSTIRISANPTGGDSSDIDHVEFYATEASPTSGPVVDLGGDATAPYSFEWTPTEAGAYTETAVAFSSTNAILATANQPVNVSLTADAVHVVAPAQGAPIGEFTGAGTLADGGTIVVSGTRSSTNPELFVGAKSRDNADGSLSALGAVSVVAAGTSGSATDQKWTSLVTVPAATGASSDVDIVALPIESDNSSPSDEVSESTLYQQTVKSLGNPADDSVTVGDSKTYNLTATDQNGNPIAGLTIAASATAGDGTISPATQVTDNSGQVTFTATAPADAGDTTYSFSSEVDGATTKAANGDITETAKLTATAQTLSTLTNVLEAVVSPGGTELAAPGEPGTIIIQDEKLVGADNKPLANTSVTIKTDHGFFTDFPPGTYTSGTFSPAIADGAAAGSLNSDTDTFTTDTNANGDVAFALGIGKDSGFDADGHVLSTLSFTADGTTQTDTPGTGQAYTWSTNSADLSALTADGVNTPLNPGTATLVAAGLSTTLTGVTSSDITDNGPTFAVHLTDQFGNLVHDAADKATVSVAGPATLTGTASDGGSYTTSPTTLTVKNNATSTAKADATVSVSWTPHTSLFKSDGGATPTYTVVSTGTATALTDSFTVSEYKVDLANLNVSNTFAPAAKVVATGTPITATETITDQFSQPVPGLFVTFEQSGPKGADVKSDATTSASGVATGTFNSTAQGNAAVAVNVYKDCFAFAASDPATCTGAAGTSVSSSSTAIGFDGTPTLKASSRTGSGTVHVNGTTRPGASVQLYSKAKGGSTYTTAAAAKTAGATGTFAFTPSIKASTTFKVIVDGVSSSAAAVSTVKAPKIVEKPKETLSSTKKGVLKASAVTSPKLKGATVKFYRVNASGSHTLIGSATTASNGKAVASIKLTAGKTYSVVAKVSGLSSTTYTSEYSTAHSKKIKK